MDNVHWLSNVGGTIKSIVSKINPYFQENSSEEPNLLTRYAPPMTNSDALVDKQSVFRKRNDKHKIDLSHAIADWYRFPFNF